ncbi:lipoprotein LpqH [Gordonia soli]|uniref:Lipoprotein n=1 Tax=Gordonia soli NBRC 108243 TaxID=1223545 RepID=M0QFC0_9ACTN|nr:lipoprotein LpqH [Gordonia soli]GAC67154.1 hypothetical protein GS4_05_03680 [Gordonia soli NBRC 108243]
MKRLLAGVVGVLACATVLTACSSDSGDSGSTNASAEVKVDGQDLAGLDTDTVTCARTGGKITVGSGQVDGKQGVGVIMTDEAAPKVESLGIVVDGNALAVNNAMGMKAGSAEVAVDGKTYTITGEAQGANLSNPTAGMVTKKFEIKVTCD